DDNDPAFAGIFTNGALERPLLDEADLFVAVGLDRVELLPRPWTHAQPMVTIDRDVPAGLHRLREHVKDIHWDPDAVRARLASQRRALIGAGPTLTPGRVVQTVAAAAPSARVTVDAGAHMF